MQYAGTHNNKDEFGAHYAWTERMCTTERKRSLIWSRDEEADEAEKSPVIVYRKCFS